MAKNTRVDYIGKHTRFAGLKGTITEVYDMGAMVLWDDGVTFPHYWSELCAVSAAKPATEATQPDPVNQPQHYASGDIECIDAIRASMTKEAFCGYLKGCAQKYFWRYEKKINPVEDIKKARWYSERLIKELEDA